MKHLPKLTILVLILSLTGCLAFAKNETLQEAKVGYACIKFEQGIPWAVIKDTFKDPDKTPLPQPGQELSQNARIYNKKTIIFYVKSERYQENGKVRYGEVVKSIELCKNK